MQENTTETQETKEVVIENQEVDLTNLDLDLSEIDSIDSDSLADFGEVDMVISENHIKFEKDDLKKAMDLAGTVINSDGNDVISKAINISVNNGKITFKATDFTSYVSYSTTCQNTQNVLTEPVTINYNLLSKILKSLGKTVAIIKKDDGYYIRLIGGDLFIETQSVDITKYDAPGERAEEIFRLAPESFGRIMKDTLPLATDAVRPEDKKIIFTGDKAVFSSMLIHLMSKGNYGDVIFKKKDMETIKKLSNISGDGIVYVYKVNDNEYNRVSVCTDNLEYSFISEKSNPDATVVETLEKISSIAGTFIDYVLLYRYVELASDLPYSTGKVGFNFDEQNVDLTIITKRGDNHINLQGASTGLLEKLQNPVTVQAKQLKKLLQAFSGCSSVKISITDKGLAVSSDDYESILMFS